MHTPTVKKPQIALNLPLVVALLLILLRHVVDMMTKNATWFPSPSPSLSDVTKHADDLESAEVNVKSRVKGAVPIRNEKKRIVEADLALLKAYILSMAALSPALAAVIIENSGMSQKNIAARLKAQFEALLGQTPLVVILRAKAAAKKAFYEWQYSMDAGKTWVGLGTTNESSTTVTVPTGGVTYEFRYRATVKKQTGAWSQKVDLFVPA
jgi:hypothetical protein